MLAQKDIPVDANLRHEVRNWNHIEVTTILMKATLENPVQSPY